MTWGPCLVTQDSDISRQYKMMGHGTWDLGCLFAIVHSQLGPDPFYAR